MVTFSGAPFDYEPNRVLNQKEKCYYVSYSFQWNESQINFSVLWFTIFYVRLGRRPSFTLNYSNKLVSFLSVLLSLAIILNYIKLTTRNIQKRIFHTEKYIWTARNKMRTYPSFCFFFVLSYSVLETISSLGFDGEYKNWFIRHTYRRYDGTITFI